MWWVFRVMLTNTDPNKYLEYQVRVPNDGLYKMQVFQSNKDIFGATPIIQKQ